MKRKIIYLFVALSLLFSLIAVGGTGTVAAAGPWYVDPLGTDNGSHGTGPGAAAFLTIQYAITAASPGDTINVAAGIYAGNIHVTKSLTIVGDPGDASPGPGPNAPVIDGGSAIGSAFFIDNGVSNVTIQGFEMRNFINGTGNGEGNGISAWEASTSDITIQDNYFHNLGWNGVLVGNDGAIGDHTGWTIKGNILETFALYGFELTNASNSSIENNVIHASSPSDPVTCIMVIARRNESGITIKGNQIDGQMPAWSAAYAAVFIAAADWDVASPNLDNVLVQDNVISTTGARAQVYVANYTTGTVTGVHVHNNNLGSLRNSTSATVDATLNWWGTTDPVAIAAMIAGTAPVTYNPWLGIPTTVYVDATYTGSSAGGHLFGYDAFTTVQEGVTAVAADGTVNVAAGTYDEQLVISKSLTVQGAGNGTIIKPSQLTANSFQIFSRSPGGAANTAAIIVASESGGSPNTVVLKNMLVDGSLVTSVPSTANGFEGILYRGAGGTIQDVNVQSINILTGNGMYLSPLNQTVAVEVTGCHVSSFQKNGITANFTGLTATIQDNTVTGIGPTTAIAQNGIQVGFGATGTVSANQVSDIAWIGTGWFPAGILFLDSSGTISDNTVTNCQGGIVVQDGLYAAVPSATIDIHGNTVSDTGYPAGVTYTAGISVTNYGTYNGAPSGTTLTATITGNDLSDGGTGTAIEVWGEELVDATLTTNTVSGWSSAGISLGGAAIGEVTISGNTISSNLNGIDIDSSVDVANVGVHCNSIVGNTVYGANNAGVGTLNAENNWWGNAGGPGVGGANPVSANIDCDPWLGAGPIQNQRTGKVYCTIQAAIDDAIPGDTINVAAGTYTEQVTVNKSLHLIGAGIGSSIIQAPGTLPAAGPTSAIVLISGGGVDAELTGFTVTGPGPSACGSISAGIYVYNGANANIHHNRIQDIRDSVFSGCQNGVAILVGRQVWATSGTATITSNTIVGYQKGGIVVDNTGSAATITNNIVTGAGTTTVTAQNGIQISRGATATLSGNTVTGNSFHLVGNDWDWGAAGVLLYQSGAVTMSGANTVSNNDQNLYIQDTTGAVTLGAESFGPSTAPIDSGYDIVNDSSFDLNATSVSFPGAANNFAIEDLVWHKLDEATGLVTWTAGNVYVTPLSGSIQRGIDAASTGWTVNVAAGTYNENIVINKQLTVQGAGNATTFINGIGTGANLTTVNITAAGDVTLSGFTITNAPVTNNTDLRFGVLTNSGTAGVTYTISHNKVIGTNNPAATEDYGIYGRNGGKENLVITNNVVTKTGANNIVVETHQGTTDISYNTLDASCDGSDAIFIMTHSGVNVAALQKVDNNTIDMGTGVASVRATGITFATAVNSTPGGTFTNVQITNNKVSNLKANRRGIGLANQATTPSAGDINGALITGNTITGAAGNVTASMGINTYGLVTNATITGNTITGVDFSFKERLNGAIIATGTKLNGNSFDNNTNGVYTERTTGTLDATNNWWGNASGPYDPSGTTEVPPCTDPTSARNTDGTGDKVSDNVLYCPWTGMNVADCLIPLKAGWNMVSVPLTLGNNSVRAVFPGVAVVYTWDPVSKTYIEPTTVEPDTGYWVAVLGNETITVTGVSVTTWTSDIKAGWNMIGSVISNASITNPNDNPDNSVQSFAYWWNPDTKTYVFTTEIQPGKGYWVAATQNCTLTLQGG